MTTRILAFDEADYDPTDIHHIVTQYLDRAAQPAGLWLDQWQAGKVGADMVKHQVPELPFEDTAEGQVVIAMKQGVIDAVTNIIKGRFDGTATDDASDLNPPELYRAAIKALDEIEKLQDGLIDGKPDHDDEA